MDWNTILGWGSPIGLGAFFAGIGIVWAGWARLRNVSHEKSVK